MVVGAPLSLDKDAVSGKHSMCLLFLVNDVVEEGWLTDSGCYQGSVLKKKTIQVWFLSSVLSLLPAILISDSGRDWAVAIVTDPSRIGRNHHPHLYF